MGLKTRLMRQASDKLTEVTSRNVCTLVFVKEASLRTPFGLVTNQGFTAPLSPAPQSAATSSSLANRPVVSQ